jgi:hypothetical protein
MHREIIRAFLGKSVMCTCPNCNTDAIFTITGTALVEVNSRNRSYHLLAFPVEEMTRRNTG